MHLINVKKGQRPEIQLKVSRVEMNVWDLFKEHHYMSESVNKSGKCYLFTWNDRPVGICVMLQFPHGKIKKGMRVSRIVVLPEFQGIQLGKQIQNFCSSIFHNDGCNVYMKTIHPGLGKNNTKSDFWKNLSSSGKKTNQEFMVGKNGEQKKWKVQSRASYSNLFIGPKMPGYEHLILPIKETRENAKNLF